MAQQMAADTGGTFTDVAVFDRSSGKISFGKTLTTYGDLADGVTAGIEEAGGVFAAAESFKHGTTHVINAFLQRKGARAAMICSQGFRDILELARGNRPAPFDGSERRDAPLIPRQLRFEVLERVSADGTVVIPLDERGLLALVPLIEAAHVDAIALSFMNSYANPRHEERAAFILKEALPHLYVTTGSSLTREWFEYERSATAAANAYVGPAIARYATAFTDRLKGGGYPGSVTMMGSNGGVMPIDASVEQPIALVESGPIGGVIAAAEYARSLGLEKVVAFDMGGTTAKCALIENGTFAVQPTYWVGGYVRGFPIRSPVLDIVEVGAGGGSIAWIDQQGRLRVGPQSAGSEPGPACFGRGGTQPTVTDANLRLGRIGGGSFLGGRLHLDNSASDAAIKRRVAEPLGYEIDDEATTRVAHGILDLATTLMAGAVKEITVARGHDVREFTLLVFGGGGPIFGAELAKHLGIRNVVVPPEPGNFSALGMLFANARIDRSRSFLADLSDEGMRSLQAVVEELRAQILDAAGRQFGNETVNLSWRADMRYRGQRHSIAVTFSDKPDAAALGRDFEAAYAKRFGRILEGNFKAEIVGIRVSAENALDKPDLSLLSPKDAGRHAEPIRRPLHIRPGGWVDAAVWSRPSLPSGFVITGPAIVEEYGSTTLLGPGDVATVGDLGEMTIRVAGRETAP